MLYFIHKSYTAKLRCGKEPALRIVEITGNLPENGKVAKVAKLQRLFSPTHTYIIRYPFLEQAIKYNSGRRRIVP